MFIFKDRAFPLKKYEKTLKENYKMKEEKRKTPNERHTLSFLVFLLN